MRLYALFTSGKNREQQTGVASAVACPERSSRGKNEGLGPPFTACSDARGSSRADQRCTVPCSLSCGKPLLYGVGPGPPAFGPGIPMVFPADGLGIGADGGIELPV